MSDDALHQQISILLQDLTANGSIHTPIAAFDLLKKLVSCGTGAERGKSVPRLRLTDLPKLEDILEKLAVSWDAGFLSVLRDDSGLTVMQLAVGSRGASLGNTRKRKRVDEDADSVEEEAAQAALAASNNKPSAAASLSNLSKDLQEVYAFLQRGTARQKLLSEQVSMLSPSYPCFDLHAFVQPVSIFRCFRTHLSPYNQRRMR